MKTAIKVLSILAVATFAYAGTEAAATKATEAAKPATEAAKTAEKATPMTCTGKIVSVDNATKTLVVAEVTKAADGKETTKEVKLTWNEQTKLMYHGGQGTPTVNDLKPGTEVMIKAGANSVATEIGIHQAAAAAKPATK